MQKWSRVCATSNCFLKQWSYKSTSVVLSPLSRFFVCILVPVSVGTVFRLGVSKCCGFQTSFKLSSDPNTSQSTWKVFSIQLFSRINLCVWKAGAWPFSGEFSAFHLTKLRTAIHPFQKLSIVSLLDKLMSRAGQIEQIALQMFKWEIGSLPHGMKDYRWIILSLHTFVTPRRPLTVLPLNVLKPSIFSLTIICIADILIQSQCHINKKRKEEHE